MRTERGEAGRAIADGVAALEPLGFCMYCGADRDLQREHVIPLALNGDIVLPKSSCRECSRITMRFEGEVLRGELLPLRARLDLKTRHPESRPGTFPVRIERAGAESLVELPIEQHPVHVTFPHFEPPGIISGRTHHGARIVGLTGIRFGTPEGVVAQELAVDRVHVDQRLRPVAFARMIAKIAWGLATARGLHDRLERGLVQAFMHDPDAISRWVGTYTNQQSALPGVLHSVQFRPDSRSSYLVADVRLFASAPTPCYGVVVAKLSDREHHGGLPGHR